MNRNKKVFAVAAIVFFVLLAYASYDISRRTTFPGSKAQLPERIEKTFINTDSLKGDTLVEVN